MPVGTPAMHQILIAVALSVAGALVSTPGARAEPPLSIQQLMADSGRWQLVTALDYHSVVGGPAGAVARSGQFTAALRYGLSSQLELNSRLRAGASDSRLAGTRKEFSSVAVGANWLLKPETDSPAVLIEGRAEIFSRVATREQTLPSAEVAVTVYRSVDPLVLSLSAAYGLRRPYGQNGHRVRPGSLWRVAPQVNFAVNHRVTLVGGLSFSGSEAARIDGTAVGTRRETVGWQAGLGYRLGPENTLFLSGDFAVDGTGSGMSLQWFSAL
jgi:hypothetical protein